MTFRIFNVLGQEVDVLVDTCQQPGDYVVHWSGEGYESGVYFYQLTSGGHFITRKLTFLR